MSDENAPWPERFLAFFREVEVHGYNDIKQNVQCGERSVLSHAALRELQPLPRSFLEVVLRLMELPVSIERYMRWVTQNADSPDDFGRAITSLQVSPIEHIYECENFLVRISRF